MGPIFVGGCAIYIWYETWMANSQQLARTFGDALILLKDSLDPGEFCM